MMNQELTIAQLQIIIGGGLASSPVGKKELNWGEIYDVAASLIQSREIAPVIERAVAVPNFL